MLDAAGHLDPERSFRYVDNFKLLASQRVRNNPQPELSPKPIDFIATVLPDNGLQHRYWLYGDEDHQLVILTDPEGNIAGATDCPLAPGPERKSKLVNSNLEDWIPVTHVRRS